MIDSLTTKISEKKIYISPLNQITGPWYIDIYESCYIVDVRRTRKATILKALIGLDSKIYNL